MLSEREQVLPVAADEQVCAGVDGTGKDGIVVRVAGDGGRAFLRRRSTGCDLSEQLANLPPAARVETEFPGENLIELLGDDIGHEKVDPAVDRRLEHAARGAVGDQRRDEDIGVAEDEDWSASSTAHLVDQRLDVLGADPALLGAKPPVPLQVPELLDLQLAPKSGADDFAFGRPLRAGSRLQVAHQRVRDRDGEQPGHDMKVSYPGAEQERVGSRS